MKRNLKISVICLVFLFCNLFFCYKTNCSQIIGVYGGPFSEVGTGVIPISDNGFLLIGLCDGIEPNGNSFPLLIRIDSEGKILWQKTMAVESIPSAPSGTIRKVSDGNYLFAGEFFYDSHEHGLLVKIDDNGNLLWQKVLKVEGDIEILDSTEEMSDGTRILLGWFKTDSFSNYLLIKIDLEGNIIWQKVLIFDTLYSECLGDSIGIPHNLIVSDDNLFVFNESWGIVKFSKDGDLIWMKQFKGSDDIRFYIYEIVKAQSGGFLIGGLSEHELWFEGVIMRISEDGEILWAKKNKNWWDYNLAPRRLISTNKGNYLVDGYCQTAEWKNILFSFEENGDIGQNCFSYESPYGYYHGGCAILDDGSLALSTGFYIGNPNLKDNKKGEVAFIKTNPDYTIENDCIRKKDEEIPLVWEDKEFVVENKTLSSENLEVVCIDTTPMDIIHTTNLNEMHTLCPIIYSIEKVPNPLRLKIVGDNLVSYDKESIITIDGAPAPVTTEKGVHSLVAKKGEDLKKMLPKGVPVCIQVSHKEPDLFQSKCFTYTR